MCDISTPVPSYNGSARLPYKIVPRTGVEPVISALKGRRPWPLDERGIPINWAPLVGARTAYVNGRIVLYDSVLCQEKFTRSHLHLLAAAKASSLPAFYLQLDVSMT